jgi:hypothetical protein
LFSKNDAGLNNMFLTLSDMKLHMMWFDIYLKQFFKTFNMVAQCVPEIFGGIFEQEKNLKSV